MYCDDFTSDSLYNTFMKTTKDSILAYLHEIKSDLSQKGFSQIGLFGSYARDEDTVYSDIDIAIQKEPDFLSHRSAYDYFDEIAHLKKLIFQKFHRNSDVFDLDSNSSMKKAILKDLIYV